MLSKPKNKDIIYAVVRTAEYDYSKDVVCCFTKTEGYAQQLANQYEQEFLDRGIPKQDFHFYVVGNVFYNE